MSVTEPDPADSRCALWYWRYHTLNYEIYDTEAGAASAAWAMQDNGGAAPVGVQFPDGRTVEIDGWAALTERWSAVFTGEAARRAGATPASPEPAGRKVRSPFGNAVVTVDASEPAWLGRPL